MLLNSRSCVSRPAPAASIHYACSSVQARPLAQHRKVICRAGEQRSSTEQDNRPVTSTSDDDVLSKSEVQKLSELKREQQRGQAQTNLLQGALEEAQLITWPTPQKAFFDTVLVLGIVALSGTVLFGLNVILAEGSEWWYHR